MTETQKSWKNHFNRFTNKFEWFIIEQFGTKKMDDLIADVENNRIEKAYFSVISIYNNLPHKHKNNSYVRGMSDFMWLVNTDVTKPEELADTHSDYYSNFTF